VRPSSDSEGALPRFWPLSRDSLRAAWAQPESPWPAQLHRVACAPSLYIVCNRRLHRRLLGVSV